MNKRILILTNHSFMLWQFRRELIAALQERGCRMIVGVPFGEHIDDFRAMGCKMIDTPLERRGMNPVRDAELYRTYIRIITDEHPDMVITYSIKPNIYGGYACRRLSVPYCVNVQGLGSAFQRRVIAHLVTAMYKIAVKDAKVVFFENEGNAAYFRKQKITPREQQQVLNGAGINLDFYVQKPYPKNERIHFLYLGRLMREKGISELFSAVRRLYADGESFVLDLVGFFEDEYKEQVEKLVADGIAVFHGFQQDARPYYEAADCVVLPSHHEGMSNVLLEAASTGRPLITSDIPGCREAVADGCSGLTCQVQDADSLYRAMKSFLSLSWEERAEMGRQERKWMEERFAKDEVVAKTLCALFS